MLENETEIPPEQASEQLPMAQAVEAGIGLVRGLLPGNHGAFTDPDLMRLIRLGYCDCDRAGMTFADRIEADAAAIKRLLSTGAVDFAPRLAAKVLGVRP